MSKLWVRLVPPEHPLKTIRRAIAKQRYLAGLRGAIVGAPADPEAFG